MTLAGIWESVPAHNGLRDRGLPKPTDDGTTFLVTEGAGGEEGPAFLTLNTNSTLKGVVIYYPRQIADAAPQPYPYAIAMRGKNPAVLDIELLNPFNGIDATHNERHLIRNVHGQPLRRGVYVDAIYDIGRIENVHFNPWWSNRPGLFQWQMANGEAFIFARSDWEYVLNTFCFGYKVGYKFTASGTGACNGNFLGIGADDCHTALVVEQSAPFGLLITNGEFVSFHGPDPTMIEVMEANKGTIRFVNCAFWGPCNQIAKIAGTRHGRLRRLHLHPMGRQGGQPSRDPGPGRDRTRAGLRISSGPPADPTGQRRPPGRHRRERLHRRRADRQRIRRQRPDRPQQQWFVARASCP